MQDLQGLSLTDFEKKGIVILGKAEVDKDGTGNFVELEDVTSFDIQSTITNLFLKTCAKSFSIELLNTNDRYSFFDTGKSKYDWIREGRKIRLYIGIKAKKTVEEIIQEESYGEVQEFSTKEEIQSSYTNLMYCTGEYSFSTGLGLYAGRCCEGNDQKTSILFQNITIPKNAKITSAKIYLQGTYDHCIYGEVEGEIGRLKIQAEKVDNPSAPISVEDWQNIETTTAYETMRIDDGRWPDVYPPEYHYTDDFSSVIEEIVNREGWVSGNNINIIFSPADDCDNGEQLNISGYYTLDPEIYKGATLEIEYQTYIPEITEESEIDSDFYWSWIYGIIDIATTRYDANEETCSISGRDYIAYLSENYLKNLWWGKQQKYDVISGKEKYDMVSECKGIHNAFIDWSGTRKEFEPMTFNSEYTYDWTTNQLVFLLPQVPAISGSDCLWIYYYTSQKVENVVADLLIEAGLLTHSHKQDWLNSDRVTISEMYIDRCWFNSGTSYLEAIELLAERALYKFFIDSEGKPCFKRIPTLLSDTIKRLNNGEYIVRNIEERLDELYNHFIIEGEKRTMKVKDLSLEIYHNPEVTTSTALLKAAILYDGGNTVTQRGFIWKKAEEAEQSWSASGEYSGLFTHTISGLNPDTEYQFCAFARTTKQYKQTSWSYFRTESV